MLRVSALLGLWLSLLFPTTLEIKQENFNDNKGRLYSFFFIKGRLYSYPLLLFYVT